MHALLFMRVGIVDSWWSSPSCVQLQLDGPNYGDRCPEEEAKPESKSP